MRRNVIKIIRAMLTCLLVALTGTVGWKCMRPRDHASNAPANAREAAARNDMLRLQDALIRYALRTGDYPSTAQGLQGLLQPASPDELPFIDRIPLDPWGHSYVYRHDQANGYVLFSAGPDGIPGTADDIIWLH